MGLLQLISCLPGWEFASSFLVLDKVPEDARGGHYWSYLLIGSCHHGAKCIEVIYLNILTTGTSVEFASHRTRRWRKWFVIISRLTVSWIICSTFWESGASEMLVAVTMERPSPSPPCRIESDENRNLTAELWQERGKVFRLAFSYPPKLSNAEVLHNWRYSPHSFVHFD